MQALLSLHDVGHAPVEPAGIAVSHVSPGSTTPLPQVAEQLLSLADVHPGGQQPSPFMQAVIGVFMQAAVHVPPFANVSVVHT